MLWYARQPILYKYCGELLEDFVFSEQYPQALSQTSCSFSTPPGPYGIVEHAEVINAETGCSLLSLKSKLCIALTILNQYLRNRPEFSSTSQPPFFFVFLFRLQLASPLSSVRYIFEMNMSLGRF